MTGTSLDGLDAAVVRVVGRGLTMRGFYHGHVSVSLGPLAAELRFLAGGGPAEPLRYLRAGRKLGEIHAQAVRTLLGAHPLPEGAGLELVVAHGQTIWHAPGDEAGPLSWQLFDPWPMVHACGVPVCYDLRQADLIAGGEGAPITPLADWILYRSPAEDDADADTEAGTTATSSAGQRIIINLGGICNITCLEDDPADIAAADLCPCNLLLDAIVRSLYPGQAYDADGRIAACGQADRALVDQLVKRCVAAMRGQRSLGREVLPGAMLEAWAQEAGQTHASADVVASGVEAVARLIVDRLPGANGGGATTQRELVLAGGGACNPQLVAAIRVAAGAGVHVRLSDERGIPRQAREAAAFAILGALSQDGVPITLPQVTGAHQPTRAGTWVYP